MRRVVLVEVFVFPLAVPGLRYVMWNKCLNDF